MTELSLSPSLPKKKEEKEEKEEKKNKKGSSLAVCTFQKSEQQASPTNGFSEVWKVKVKGLFGKKPDGCF